MPWKGEKPSCRPAAGPDDLMTARGDIDHQPSCGCRGGCRTKRCACLRSGQPCRGACRCVRCKNPLNGVDVSQLSRCAIDHIEAYKALSKTELEATLELPCGCEQVPLRKLIHSYECTACKEDYWYSFCLGEAVQDNCTWHCADCGTCRDWREWHCETCNRCTYGVSMPCEHCADDGLDW